MKPRQRGETLGAIVFVVVLLITAFTIFRFGSVNMRHAAEDNNRWRMEWASRR